MPRADNISQVVWGRHCGMQAEEVIEDWELWGDPREVERRKADRARAAQPLHVRQAQVRQTSLQHIGIDAMFMCDK